MSAMSVENCVGIIRTQRYDIQPKQCKFHCGENVSRWGSCKLMGGGGVRGGYKFAIRARTCSKFKPRGGWGSSLYLCALDAQNLRWIDAFAFWIKSALRDTTSPLLKRNRRSWTQIFPLGGNHRGLFLALNCARAALKIAFLMFEGRARFKRGGVTRQRASFSRHPDKIHSQWVECMHLAAAFVCPLITAHFDKAPLY